MKSLTQDQLEYIKSYERSKSPRTIARDLKLEVREVQAALESLREPGKTQAPVAAPTVAPRDDRKRPWIVVAIIAAIVLLGALAYANNLHDGYHFDDSHSITANEAIQNPSFQGIYRFNLYRQVLYWTFAASWKLHGPNVVGWHVENDAIHVLNGILVFVFGLLTFRTPGARGATRWPELVSGLAALLFVLHPVQTQAVTYLTQRTESLAATFYLVALILYALARLRRLEGRAQGRNVAALPLAAGVLTVLLAAWIVIRYPSGTIFLGITTLQIFLGITALAVGGGIAGTFWLAQKGATDAVEGALLTGALAATFFGLETKEIAGTIPIAIVLWELLFTRPPGVCPLRTRPLEAKLEHFAATAPWVAMLVVLPVLAISAGLSVKFMAAENSEEHAPGFSISGGEYFVTQLNVLATYLRVFLLPYGQSLDYDYPKATSLFSGGPGAPPPILSLVALAGLLGLAARSWERRPLLSWTILFSLVVLLPTSTFFVLPDFIYEHRIYLPVAGAALLGSLVLERVVRRALGADDALARKVFVGAAIPVLLLCVFLTRARNEVWLNEETLWKDCLEKAPRKPRPKTNLGLHYQNSEPFTLTLRPGAQIKELEGGRARGYAYPQGGQIGGEIVDGDQRGKPGLWIVRPTLGERHSLIEVPKEGVVTGPVETGGTRKAVALYEAAIAIDGNYFKARNNYAICAVQDGSRLMDQSIDLRRAVAGGGLSNPDAATRRADELAAQATTEFEKAATQLQAIIEMRPRDYVAMSNLANLYFQYLDRLDDAIDWMEKSVAIDTSNTIVFAVLGEMHYVRAVDKASKQDPAGALVDLRRALWSYQAYLGKAGSSDPGTEKHIRHRKELTEQGIKDGGKLEDPGVGPIAPGTEPTFGPGGNNGTAPFRGAGGAQPGLNNRRFKPVHLTTQKPEAPASQPTPAPQTPAPQGTSK